MTTRIGPLVRIESSCIGCDHLIPGGERPPQCLAMAGRMMPTTSPAPVWCPELHAAQSTAELAACAAQRDEARAELAKWREVTGADTPHQLAVELAIARSKRRRASEGSRG